MLSVEEARERILSYFATLPVEAIPLVDSLGQVLAEDVVATFDIPPLANSAMLGSPRDSPISAAIDSASGRLMRPDTR